MDPVPLMIALPALLVPEKVLPPVPVMVLLPAVLASMKSAPPHLCW